MHDKVPGDCRIPESGEFRIAHSRVSRMAYLDRHRVWLERVLGCKLSQALIVDLEPPITRFAVAELLQGVPLYRSDGRDEPVTGNGHGWFEAEDGGVMVLRRSFAELRAPYVGEMSAVASM